MSAEASELELRIHLPSDVDPAEARTLLAVKLYELGKVSLGRAAMIAELPKRDFMAALGKQKVPVFRYDPEDLRRELEEIRACQP